MTTLAGILTSFNSSSSCSRQCNVSPLVFFPSSEISGAPVCLLSPTWAAKLLCYSTYQALCHMENTCLSFPQLVPFFEGQTGVQSWRRAKHISGKMNLLPCPQALHPFSSPFPTILSQLGGYCPALATHSQQEGYQEDEGLQIMTTYIS